MDNFGFILLRHVNSQQTDEYWKRSYETIRLFHPTSKIIIIDDNSNPAFLTEYNNNGESLTNCEIIQSEFPARGELLPYYYYYHHKFFDKAIILHDSMFLNIEIDIETICEVDKVLFLWHFLHHSDYVKQQRGIIENSNISYRPELLQLHDQMDQWVGCFGVCSIITHDFLKHIFEKYIMVDLMNHIQTKDSRCCLERIFALICHLECPELLHKPSLWGRVEFYMYPHSFNLTYRQYLENINEFEKYPVIKVWSGR